MRSGYALREPCRGDGVPRAFAERREEEHARAAQVGALHESENSPPSWHKGETRQHTGRGVQLWSATLCPKAPERGINMVRFYPYSTPWGSGGQRWAGCYG